MPSRLTAAWESGVRFSLEQAKDILKAEFNNIPGVDDYHPDLAKVILLLGKHGIGKTRVVQEGCNEAAVEFAGWHVGATGFEDNLGLQEIIENGSGRKTVHRASAGVPGFSRPPMSKSGRGCLFHDEVFTGTVEHQNQLRMIISGKLGELSLQPGWIQVAASNPDTTDYSTVQEVDEALASRFVILCVDPTDDEKLVYWRSNNTLPDKLYTFLQMHKMHIATLDSRAWANLGHSFRKWEAAGLSRNMIIKLFEANINKVVAANFATFLSRGDDPEQYPIDAMALVLADDKQHSMHMKRLSQWIAKGETATIGATMFDLRILFVDVRNADKVKQLMSKHHIACARAVDVLLLLLDSHRALVADMVMHVKKGPLVNELAMAICEADPRLQTAIYEFDNTADAWINKK